VTLKATLAAAIAALAAVTALLVSGHVGRTEPKSQIDQIEVGRT
jgi:hypothetical protein